MNETDSIAPVFYLRGFNSPYSEGHIVIARNMIRALSLCGIKSTVFNYKYYVREQTNDHEDFSSAKFEQNIPIVKRDEFLYEARMLGSKMIVALLIEALATLRFLSIEKHINNKHSSTIVNVVNCFRYPRSFARVFLGNPVVLHFYVRNTLENMARLIIDKTDMIIVSSRSLADHYEKRYGINRLKLKIIYPPIDTDFYKPADKDLLRKNIGVDNKAKVILYMGNLRVSRFPEEIVLPLIGKMVKKDPETALFIYAPETSQNIKRKTEILIKARRLNLAANVKIDVRNLSEIEKSVIYSTSDVFLFPSLAITGAAEPPLTILEAMSSGLVAVSGDLPSTKEIIDDGINGLIMPFGNGEVSQMEERISAVIEDREAMSMMSDNARRNIIEKMSLDDSGTKLIELFRSLSR